MVGDAGHLPSSGSLIAVRSQNEVEIVLLRCFEEARPGRWEGSSTTQVAFPLKSMLDTFWSQLKEAVLIPSEHHAPT